MANILIQGLNSKSGGGKSILDNYLKMLIESNPEDNYYILAPNKNEYLIYEKRNIKIVDIPDIYKNLYMVYFRYEIALPKLVRNLKIDIIFNLSDVPIPVKNIKQIFLFDWPYAVYPESIVWKKMDKFSAFERKLKLYFFKKYLPYVTTTIAQTDTMQQRLERFHSLRKIKIVPNAVSLENLDGGEYKNFNLPDGKKLLYLCVYFPHKNIEIFIPLAKKIKEQKLDFKIIITINESQHRNVKLLLAEIKKNNLEDIIINIGPVKMKHVPSLYMQCDGLLMPTLLESFGLTYIEAMHNKKPIFTSDIDFAHDVCGKSAYYFDPLNAEDILKQITYAFSEDEIRKEKIEQGTKVLSKFLSWEDVLKKYEQLIEDVKNGR